MTDQLTGTESALDLIADMAAEQSVEDRMAMPEGDLQTLDAAAEKIGVRTVEFVGLPDQYRPGAAGDEADVLDYAARSIDVHPAATGPGLVIPVPSRGSVDSRSSLIRLIRVAKNEHDAHDTFASYRDATAKDFSFGAGDYQRVAGLEFNVKVADGRRAILEAEAWIDGQPVTSEAAIDVVICIGNEGVRVADADGGGPISWAANLTGSDSKSIPIGRADGRHQGFHVHGRLIEGTADTESAGVPCFVKVKQIGASGGNGGGTTNKFKPNDQVQTISAVNMRTSPAISDSNILILLSQGQTGTVNSGPQRANGYTWWNCTFGGNTGWVAENFLKRLTVDPPQPTTSTIRGGLLRVHRRPL